MKSEQKPVAHCGAQVCGMHPAHLYDRDGVPTMCPGSGA